jgi:hypothetical protein
VADFALRWSAIEATKPYASPFGVTFVAADGAMLGGIAVNGPDLLYYRQFQQAVLRLAGELFAIEAVDAADDAQRAWLDLLGTKMKALDALALRPESFLEETVHERRFRYVVQAPAGPQCRVDPSVLVDYQELQAALAHLTGRLYRNREVEAVQDPEQRRTAWLRALRTMVDRPTVDDRIAEAWPW